jgi:hypothetical protein
MHVCNATAMSCHFHMLHYCQLENCHDSHTHSTSPRIRTLAGNITINYIRSRVTITRQNRTLHKKIARHTDKTASEGEIDG